MRAFEGPNGWYIADEDTRGFHRQPESGGTMTEAEARAAAAAPSVRYSDDRDLHGHYDDE